MAAALAAGSAASRRRQQQGGREADPLGRGPEVVAGSAAALAAAAELLAQGGTWPQRSGLTLQLTLAGRPFGAVAACFAALRLLLGALGPACPGLARLALRLEHPAMGELPAYQLSQLQRAWGAHVVQGLRPLLESNPGIRWAGGGTSAYA